MNIDPDTVHAVAKLDGEGFDEEELDAELDVAKVGAVRLDIPKLGAVKLDVPELDAAKLGAVKLDVPGLDAVKFAAAEFAVPRFLLTPAKACMGGGPRDRLSPTTRPQCTPGQARPLFLCPGYHDPASTASNYSSKRPYCGAPHVPPWPTREIANLSRHKEALQQA